LQYPRAGLLGNMAALVAGIGTPVLAESSAREEQRVRKGIAPTWSNPSTSAG
jgi:hypothetical protein